MNLVVLGESGSCEQPKISSVRIISSPFKAEESQKPGDKLGMCTANRLTEFILRAFTLFFSDMNFISYQYIKL